MSNARRQNCNHHSSSVFSQKVVTRFFSQMELYSRHGLEVSHASNPNFFFHKIPIIKGA